MKRVEKAWVRMYGDAVLCHNRPFAIIANTRRGIESFPGTTKIIRVTLTYDDGTKPKKRKAKKR